MQAFLDPISNHYADFDGKVERRPFWIFILLYIVLSIIISVVEEMLSTNIIHTLYGLVLLVPSLAITTRRLHDTGRSGWWQLLWLVPILGWFVLVIFLAEGSKVKVADIPAQATGESNEK